MAARRRPPIPETIETQLLFLNDHTCCICRTRGKDVQIHHMDGNRTNNSPSNLAVLCLDCHSRVTGPRGLGRAFKPGEVRRYKKSWERFVFTARGISSRPKPTYPKELISQVDLVVCETLADAPDARKAKQRLEVLYELSIWKGDFRLRKQIIEGLHHLAVMTGLMHPALSPRVAQLLWQMCWQFVGPDRITMDKNDRSLVMECIDALESLAIFDAIGRRGKDTATAVAESAQEFLGVALAYQDKTIAEAVVKLHSEALKTTSGEVGERAFSRGTKIYRRSLTYLAKELKRDAPTWSQPRSTISALLMRHTQQKEKSSARGEDTLLRGRTT